MTVQPHRSRSRYIRRSTYAVLLVLLAFLLATQRSQLGKAFTQATQASPPWLAAGILAMALSLPATALVYVSLSPKRLRFGRTLLVQTAGFCINKLLPSGSGAAGVSFLYLRANKLSGVQAGSIVALNNVLGLIGHFIVFWLLVALEPRVLGTVHISGLQHGNRVAVIITGFIVVLVVVGLVFRRQLSNATRRYKLQIKAVLTNRPALLKALGFSMAITLSYTLTLYASAHAVGATIGLSAAIIALSSSVLATSVIPSPGGIGAAEIGAYGGLVAVGVDSHAALAAALLYRVCSFWLPLALGSVAFAVVSKRGYLSSRSVTTASR